jgi:rubrerythrin
MSKQNFKKWVCTALEMEEKGRSFYEKALAQCEQGLGKEIFTMLMDDEVRHIQRIREIEKALDQGSGLEQACRLDDQQNDLKKVFRDMAAGSLDKKPCVSTAKALQTGIDFELALVAFYEEALNKAEEDLEKEFLRRMVAEEKGHYMLLSDLNYYYEDPEGWAMEQGRGGLDGA